MGTTYQVICDRCAKSYLTTDDTPPLWCGCGPHLSMAGPGRPDCLVGFMPMKLERFVSYTLPDVPLEEQTIVLDPDDPQWFFITRTDDVEALQGWLRWYHQSKRRPRKARRNQTTPSPK